MLNKDQELEAELMALLTEPTAEAARRDQIRAELLMRDVDYRTCERCGERRHVSSMSVKGPARVWACAPCDKIRSDALDEMAAFSQEFEGLG